MFEKLRKRFIISALSAVAIVVACVVASINISFKITADTQAKNIVNIILNNNGDFVSPDNRKMPIESPYDTRWFIVKEQDGERYYNLSHISINQSQASQYADVAHSLNYLEGYVGNFRFGKSADNKTIVFVDCEKQLSSQTTLLILSSITGLLSILTIYFIIEKSSYKVLKPVNESYMKQKQFITNASHELKTPLTIISANNELIELTKGSNEYSDNINKQISKMNTMIKELSSLAKMQEAEFEEKTKINISDLVNEMCDSFEDIFKKNNLEFNRNIQQDIYLNSNKTLISRMISILLDNAIKYGENDVELVLSSTKKQIVLKQSNKASNIKNEDLSRYLDRFYRGNEKRNVKEGSGVGLSILKEIVDSMNGKIKIYGKDGRFNIEITFQNKSLL